MKKIILNSRIYFFSMKKAEKVLKKSYQIYVARERSMIMA